MADIADPDSVDLPTPLALVRRRLVVLGTSRPTDSFLVCSYLFELLLKLTAIVFHGALRSRDVERAHAIGYALVRGDGLGDWKECIDRAAAPVSRGFLPKAMRPLSEWLARKRTKPADDWFRQALDEAQRILRRAGVADRQLPRAKSVSGLLDACVQIRNKTKAHGAFGLDFYGDTDSPYRSLITAILMHSPLVSLHFFYLGDRIDEAVIVNKLCGVVPSEAQQFEAMSNVTESGVYVVLSPSSTPVRIPLLLANRELTKFHVPNGNWKSSSDSASAEFIDYASGETSNVQLAEYARPPAPLPKSTTHGLGALDVIGEVFSNVPNKPSDYVPRPHLQDRLLERLLDRNHAIITLHGAGGVGKTSLGIWAAHTLSNRTPSPFEQVVWMSARDLDLRPAGPASVKPAVSTLKDVASLFGKMFDLGKTPADFARVLQEPIQGSTHGTLFIFDNFETLADPRGLHEFLDTHTYLPNKVLITSRARAFKADYPIEVLGMEWPQAEVVIKQAAARFNVEGIATYQVKEKIFKYAQGNPYVMLVLTGEMASAGRFVSPKSFATRRTDVLGALFERSFDRLSVAGRWVFLLASNWRALIPEIAIYAVGVVRDIDVLQGIEEARRLSLIREVETSDEMYCYEVPQVARDFGRKKLVGDRDRLAIQADLETLRAFGAVRTDSDSPVVELLERYVRTVEGRASGMTEEETEKTDRLLVAIAKQWADAWRHVAEFRYRAKRGYEAIEYASRRCVEEQPNNPSLWQQRANYAREFEDKETEVACWVEAVEIKPTDLFLLGEAANQLNQFVGRIPQERRQYYLASVRDRMERVEKKLDATGRSRLGWLYLHEGDSASALRHAKAGLKLDDTNKYCRKLKDRIDSQKGET